MSISRSRCKVNVPTVTDAAAIIAELGYEIFFDVVSNNLVCFDAEGEPVSIQLAAYELAGHLMASGYSAKIAPMAANVLLRRIAIGRNMVKEQILDADPVSAEETAEQLAAAAGKPELFNVFFLIMCQQVALNCFQTPAGELSQEFVPIFAGAQGTGKTRAVRSLCPFGKYTRTETLPLNLLDKDCIIAISSCAAYEIAEIDETIGMQSANRLKPFITSGCDFVRPPYEAKEEARPRRCCIYGTTNKQAFLVDETGNRRFFVIDWGRADIRKFKEICKEQILGAYHDIYIGLQAAFERGGIHDVRKAYVIDSIIARYQQADNLARIKPRAGTDELLDLIDGRKIQFSGTASELKERFPKVLTFDVRTIGKAIAQIAADHPNVRLSRTGSRGRYIEIN